MREAIIRPLLHEDADHVLPLRLEALRLHPEAFGADFSEENRAVLPRLIGQPPALTLGCFDGDALVGMAGLMVSGRVKQRHKGQVFAVYVTPSWRGTGLARAMMRRLIEHAAASGLRSLTLTVTVGNDSALHLYRSLGFRSYGTEPGSLCVGGYCHDEELMALTLDPANA